MKKLVITMLLLVTVGIVSCDDHPAKTPLWCVDTCQHGGICVSLKDGSNAECQCPTGYEGSLCQLCADGYEQDEEGNCEEIVIDYCESDPCKNGGTCSSFSDSFSCDCVKGYIGDICADCDTGYIPVDESCVIDPCAVNPCANGGTCGSSTGIAVCTCVGNYTGDDCSGCKTGFVLLDDQTCTINSCDPSPCQFNGTCSVDTSNGNPICSCVSPHTGDTCTGCLSGYTKLNNGSCVVDLCLDENCSGHGTCLVDSDDGSARCTCGTGYEPNGLACEDINECLTNPCFGHANCSNEDGGYDCTCHTGYTGVTCDDCDTVNGFVENPVGSGLCVTNTCSPNPCQNGGGCTLDASNIAQCSCPEGYQDGAYCDDVDECDLNTDNCSQNCSNIAGSFTCSCNAGYELNVDGFTCDDVDECDLNTDNCDVNASCSNTVGAYDCACNTGYLGDGFTCPSCDTANDYFPHDDKCLLDPCSIEDCGGHGTCSINTGTWTAECACLDGYLNPSCASCADNHRRIDGYCVPVFAKLGGGAIQSIVEANGELYGLGNNEIVMTYDATADNWMPVWRPDLSWTDSEAVRNDFLASVSDGISIYSLKRPWGFDDWHFLSDSKHSYVVVFTPSSDASWLELAELPYERCNDIAVNDLGTKIWVVCDNGNLYKYNFGTELWDGELLHNSTDLALNKIWFDSDDNVHIVGDDGWYKRWNGSSWLDLSDPLLDTDLYGVWGYTNDDLWIGGAGKLWHWNGSSYSEVANYGDEDYYFRKIHGTSTANVIVALAIGDWFDNTKYSTRIYQSVDGTNFTYSTEFDYYYQTVSCFESDCLLAGMDGVEDKPTKMRWLSESEMIIDQQYVPRTISGNSSTDILFAGQFNAVTHYDGHRYQKLDVPVNEDSNDDYNVVWPDGTGAYWIAGPGADLNPTGYLVRWDGSSYDASAFTKHSSDATEVIHDVHGCSADDIWAVGGNPSWSETAAAGTVIHWDGNFWTRVAFPHPATLKHVLCVAPDEVYATGKVMIPSYGYHAYVYKWDGSTWSVVYDNPNSNAYPKNCFYDEEESEICCASHETPSALVRCSADAGDNWSVYITTSAGMSIAKMLGSKKQLLVLGTKGRLAQYQFGVELIVHRDSSNTSDDDGQTWFDIWQESNSGSMFVIGDFSQLLIHK